MKIFENKISLVPLTKAKKQLQEAAIVAKSDLERSGAIQLFEICYELSWKSMQKIMVELGFEQANSPRSVFKLAHEAKLINNLDVWLETISQRNLTVHTYNEDLANEVFEFIPTFLVELDRYLENVKNLKG